MEPEKMSENSINIEAGESLSTAQSATEAVTSQETAMVASNSVIPEIEVETKEETTAEYASGVPTPKSKEEIVAALEAAIEMPVAESKNTILQLKASFYAIRKQEIEAELAAFLELGNEQSAFAAKEDALEVKVKELLNAYKEKKAQYLLNLENERKANLVAKENILAQLNEIAADTDNINRHYAKFQQLQLEFKTSCELPPENVTSLWKQYQAITESFYDRLKINKDLRDYDFKKNLEAKEALAEQAEALSKSDEDIIEVFKKLQTLHEQWREIGPVAPESRETIWNRFKEASTIINKKHQAYFEEKKQQEADNEAKKAALCEVIESLDTDTLKSFADWDNATEKIKAAQENWKSIGYSPRKSSNELYARFRAKCDEFFDKKTTFYKTVKDEAAENAKKKEALCEKAESMKDDTEWRKTTDKFIALQKEWKNIGSAGKRYNEPLRKRFSAACNYFFEQKEQQLAGQKKVEQDNLKTKNEILAKLRELLATNGKSEELVANIRNLSNQWRQTGHVPFKHKDKLQNEFATLTRELNEKFDLREIKSRISNFENSVEKLAGDNNKLYKERDKLIFKYEQKKKELLNYENNLNFFRATSKTGNSLLKDMEHKMSLIREDLLVLEKKIALIDEKL